MNSTRNESLILRDVSAGYGRKVVVSNISFEVRSGEIVALIGPNGAGKSTVLKAIVGLTAASGELILGTRSLDRLSTAQRIAQGIGYCPQGNRVFNELSVFENLEVAGHMLPSRQLRVAIDKSLAVMPILQPLMHRLAGVLSGGEQQMLALARSLVPEPKVLMLDEPTAGLTPLLTTQVLEAIHSIAAHGIAILMVEQKVKDALLMAHSAICLRSGQIVYRGPANELVNNEDHLASLFF